MSLVPSMRDHRWIGGPMHVHRWGLRTLAVSLLTLPAIVVMPQATHAAPRCGDVYCGIEAATWASAHALDPAKYESDCTWFVSQAMWTGGLPKTARWTDWSADIGNRGGSLANGDVAGWPTATATVADRLKNYLVSEARIATIRELSWRENEVYDAKLGDLIAYDWDGPADGFIDHLSIVTNFSSDNHAYPLVSQHSPGQVDRGWTFAPGADPPQWIERAKPGSRVYLIHITY